MKPVLVLAPLILLAACDRSRVNPPTEPARPITSPIVDATAEAPSDSMAPLMPGTGPTSFIGRWSADPALCAAPQGNRRPLEITTVRFESEEGGCDIAHIDQVTGGYQATLSCLPKGATPGGPAPNGERVERVQMSVVGQTLDLIYVDRRGQDGAPRSVKLLKCTTLTDTSQKAPGLSLP